MAIRGQFTALWSKPALLRPWQPNPALEDYQAKTLINIYNLLIFINILHGLAREWSHGGSVRTGPLAAPRRRAVGSPDSGTTPARYNVRGHCFKILLTTRTHQRRASNGGQAGRQGRRRAGARAAHAATPDSLTVRHAIDTEVWLRGLLLARAARPELDPSWATKDQVHDEALGWFLQRHTHEPLQDYPARRAGDEDLTFWVDSRIIERARRMAARDGVKLARLIDAALNAYVREHIPRELIEFRQRVQGDAQKLYAALRGGLPGSTRPRKAGM
jgi:hypothetical protein